MPMDKSKYPADWEAISIKVRNAALWMCELCACRHGHKHFLTGSVVILTVHHIDGDPKNNHRSNLIALCQRCHLRLDRPYKLARRRKQRSLKI